MAAIREPELKKARMNMGKQDETLVDIFQEIETDFARRIAQAAEDLKVNGFAVIEGVMDNTECDVLITRIWDWIERASAGRIRKGDPDTWQPWIPAIHWIYKHLNVGHSSPCWSVRLNKRVQEVFARLYGTDKLCVSYDGFSFQPKKEKFAKEKKPWLHIDQSPYKPGLRCIQGAMYLEGVGPKDAGTTFIPKSHLIHRELEGLKMAPVNVDKDTGKVSKNMSNWYKFEPEQLDYIEKTYGEKRMKVVAKKGSLVLWDSRTIHAGSLPSNDRAPEEVKERAIVYVCFQPDRYRSDTDRKNWREAAQTGRTTSHWPIKRNMNQLGPRTYGVNPALLPATESQPNEFDLNDPVVQVLTCHKTYREALPRGLLGWGSTRPPLMNFIF